MRAQAMFNKVAHPVSNGLDRALLAFRRSGIVTPPVSLQVSRSHEVQAKDADVKPCRITRKVARCLSLSTPFSQLALRLTPTRNMLEVW